MLTVSGPMQAKAENEALVRPVDWTEPDHMKDAHQQSPVTEVRVGKDHKPFHVPTSLLKEKSPYFRDAKTTETSFDDLDEFSMALFMHWLESDGKLYGPHDFHSLAHYLSLYVLAKKFRIEGLENQVMDLVRHYYRDQNMTSPSECWTIPTA